MILYQFNHLSMFRQTIVKGLQQKEFTNVFQNNQPKLAMFALVESDVWSSVTKRPFIFKKHDVSELTLRTEGRQIGGEAMKCDSDMQVYAKFCTAMGIFNTNESIGIDLDQFKDYSYLFAFDCTPNLSVSSVQEPSLRTYDLDIRFKTTTGKNLDLLIFFIEDKRVILQGNNNVVANDFIPPAVK